MNYLAHGNKLTLSSGSDCTEVATKWESLSSSQEDGLASLDEPQTLGALPIIPFSSDNRERDPKLLLRYGFLQHVPAVSSVHGRTARFQIVASLPLSTSSKLFLKRVKRISIDSSPPAPV